MGIKPKKIKGYISRDLKKSPYTKKDLEILERLLNEPDANNKLIKLKIKKVKDYLKSIK